jgi:hypothetical protein
MLTSRRTKRIAATGAVALCAVLFLWWASCGYPTDEPICSPPPNDYDCQTHNVIIYFVWAALNKLNFYGAAITAIATGFIAFFTIVLARVGRKADSHFQVVERAYVKLSHHPPGVYWENPRPADLFYGQKESLEYWVRIDLRAKNFGKTPAHVTQICLAYQLVGKDESLPDTPNYSVGTIGPAHAFLVADDEFTHITRRKIAIEDKESIWKGEKRLFVFAYVEYRDKFGNHHRGRYARRYEHGADVAAPINIHTGERLIRDESIMRITNLTFVDQPTYNSDITQHADGSWPES